jgi:hypothetical protein
MGGCRTDANTVCDRDTVCSCGINMDPTELAVAWQKRALPVMVRLMRHGHMVNRAMINRTMELLIGVEKGSLKAPESYNPESSSSHHLPGCSWRSRFR